MRIGSTLLVQNQKCVQSYGWSHLRPLGSLQLAMDSLEEYKCDEVAIIRPARDKDTLELFSRDIEIIRVLKSMTPISFGGGIRTLNHLKLLQDLPIERLVLSSAFISRNTSLIDKAINLFGHQAIQCLLPVKFIRDEVFVYDCENAQFLQLRALDLALIDDLANEVVLYDIDNDGCRNCFNKSLVESFSFVKSKLVITGGIGKAIIDWAKQQELASVLIDNKVLHQEYSIKGFKRA